MSSVGQSSVRYSRNDIIAAALRLLDDVGLADLTMRRLAHSLDLQASALYWHVADKQTMLAAVADRILAQAPPVPEGLGWEEALAAHAHTLREALLAYRDAAEVVASSVALGLGGEQIIMRLRFAVSAGGFDADTTRAGASAILHFVLGHVWHEQQRTHADSVGVTSPGVATGVNDFEVPSSSASADFDFGVALLVGGLVAQRSKARHL